MCFLKDSMENFTLKSPDFQAVSPQAFASGLWKKTIRISGTGQPEEPCSGVKKDTQKISLSYPQKKWITFFR